MGCNTAILCYKTFDSLGKNPFVTGIGFRYCNYFVPDVCIRLIFKNDNLTFNMSGCYKVRSCLCNRYKIYISFICNYCRIIILRLKLFSCRLPLILFISSCLSEAGSAVLTHSIISSTLSHDKSLLLYQCHFLC